MKALQLQKIQCRSCRELRWDDGTPCAACGTYENRFLQRDERGLMVDARRTMAKPSDPYRQS